MNRQTRILVEDLFEQAFSRSLSIRTTDQQKIEHATWRNEPIPDYLLPGRMIMRMSAEDREKLSTLRSSDLANYRFSEAIYISRSLIGGRAISLIVP